MHGETLGPETAPRSIMTTRFSRSIAALFITALAACGGGQAPAPPPEPDLLAVLKSRPSLTRFAEAVESTGVAAQLQASGAYTVFAPMDAAVNGELDQATVRHHITNERVTFADMAGESTSYTTLNGDEMEVDVTEQIAVGSGLMVESDILAANGVIHVIDRVQTPAAGGGAPVIEAEPIDEPEEGAN